MFKNPRRGRQARNFTTNVPKILDLKSSSEQIFSRKLSLGAPAVYIAELISRYQPTRTLRSSSCNYLSVTKCSTNSYGDRSFAAASVKLWNSLPLHLRNCKNLLALLSHNVKPIFSICDFTTVSFFMRCISHYYVCNYLFLLV